MVGLHQEISLDIFEIFSFVWFREFMHFCCWSGYFLRIAANCFICSGVSFCASCRPKIWFISSCSISPSVEAARYSTSRAFFPRMGAASMRKCKLLFSGRF